LGIDIINKKEHLIFAGFQKLIYIRGSMNTKSLSNLNKYFKVDIPVTNILGISKEILDPY
jgi:hypothetical protein